MNRKLKRSHKGLMIVEAGFIYCKRHNLDEESFIDNVFMTEDFNCEEGSEFDNICKDLRCFRRWDYTLKEITESEYELCIDKFGEN
jgi:hypothetical protein